MNAFLLISTIITISLQSVVKKAYNNKTGGSKFIFPAVSCLVALLFFVVSGGFKFNFTKEIIPYALLFGISYGTATIFSFLSIQAGPLSLTSLITSYSLVVPTFYSIIFRGDEASLTLYFGIAVLLISLLLMNLKTGADKESVKISLKWVIYVTLAFLGNGVCSTVANVQQLDFEGLYKNEFMIIALTLVVLTLFIISYFSEKERIPECVKKGAWMMIVCGLANAVSNLFVLMLSGKINGSIMFPLISAGGIILTSLVSIFIYREKLSKLQYGALALGIVAVVLLNL